jgi:hypothetical protein
MAGEAVSIAPFSAQIPCKQGILQGNITNFAFSIAQAMQKVAILKHCPQNPTKNSREIISGIRDAPSRSRDWQKGFKTVPEYLVAPPPPDQSIFLFVRF